MAKKLRIFLILFWAFSAVCPGFSQSRKVSKKAQALYERANKQIRTRDFENAKKTLEKAIKKDPEFLAAYMKLASCYAVFGDVRKENEIYMRVLEKNIVPRKYPRVYASLANYEFGKGKYLEARKNAQEYLKYLTSDRRLNSRCRRIVENVDFALKTMKNPQEFEPRRLDKPLNQFGLQYFPTLTVDGKTIFFTKRDKYGRSFDEDIYYSTKDKKGNWSVPRSISKTINTPFNEGTCSISADGKTLIFTSCANKARKSYGNCDLYVSYRQGNRWSKPKNLGPSINTKYWESQPSLTADGRMLYFVSDRPTGLGGRDIYFAYRKKDGTWSHSINLGPKINTRGEDIGPFIHVNGETLYFASDSRKGMGGFDLYFANRSSEGWSEVKHMGYPINNHDDQISLVVSTDGKKGYYSEDVEENGAVFSYMYQFDIPEVLKIEKQTNYVQGIVRDAVTKQPLASVIELSELETDSLLAKVRSDSITGQYSFVLNEGKEYGLFASSPGYLFHSETFNHVVKDDINEPLELDIEMQPIKERTEVRLNNVFFQTGKYQVQEKSFSELRKVASFLKKSPNLEVLIEGHTDDVGSELDNQQLSEKRAQAVYNFLIGQGVNVSQIGYKGFGESAPVAPNDSDLNRQKNRRIEFRIVKNG